MAAKMISSCRYLKDFEKVINVPKRKLALYALKPDFYTFHLPKDDGTFRLIEAPHEEFKKILKTINFYFQSAYYLVKPPSSFGYIMSSRNEKDPRNILTHAQKHLGNDYLLNVDFEDFFHQFDINKVEKILFSYPFHFTAKAAATIARICTYNGRLPMGSPTSPVLSNLGTLPLDNYLQNWATDRSLLYTRFVDDLSFSSQKRIPANILAELTTIFKKFDYQLNEEKSKWYGKQDTKIVTGLEVDSKVSIPGSFFYELSQDIIRLKKTIEASIIIEGDKPSTLVVKFKQQIEGKLNFMGMIYGFDNEKYDDYYEDYEEAINPDMEKFSLRWTDFPYHL